MAPNTGDGGSRKPQTGISIFVTASWSCSCIAAKLKIASWRTSQRWNLLRAHRTYRTSVGTAVNFDIGCGAAYKTATSCAVKFQVVRHISHSGKHCDSCCKIREEMFTTARAANVETMFDWYVQPPQTLHFVKPFPLLRLRK
jgi:hypothetical protein